jgi:hypothetical protein
LVRNPLGYIFRAALPNAAVPVLDHPPQVEDGYQLSVKLASALGFGTGCDASDDDSSVVW